MDDKHFDNLARLIGKGASRRAILKGLLGIGGAAVTAEVASESTGARSPFTRTRIPPPPPPTTTTTTTTAAPCPAGQQQCPNSTLCCPTGTCARAGNQAICCDGTLGNGDIVCGLDCCDEALECCDGECCPTGTVCLARVFGEGPFVEEETCCPEELTCRTPDGDGICCDGECFDPELIVNDSVFPLQVDPFDRTCCPAGGEVCPGTNGTFCCQGETPDCCQRADGTAVCINEATQCCLNNDCNALDDPANCLEGVCRRADQACEQQPVCAADEVCCMGGDDTCCGPVTGEGARVCCGPACCESGFECCDREVDGVLIQTCIDPTTQCCVARDCFEEPFNFDRGCVACPPTGPNANTCVPRNEGEGCGTGECDTCYQGQCLGCDSNETCCLNAPFPVCVDVTQEGVCCTSDQCPDDPETCAEGVCIATECALELTCDAEEVCCPDAAGGFGCLTGTACPTTTTTTTTTTTATPTTTTTTAAPTTTSTTTTAAPTTTTVPPTTTTVPPTTTTQPPCIPPLPVPGLPDEGSACDVNAAADQCCGDAFCCEGYCVSASSCCGTAVNPCTVCNVCSLGLCIGDSTQNGNTCDTSRVCCEGLCCNVGDICPGFDTAQVGPAAVATCCTPSGCPAGNLGDLCGTGVPDLNCGTIVPGSCACTAGVCDETLGTCCLPDGVGSACGTNGALCCSGVCNSQGYCGCVIEGSECSTGDTCCAGGTYECNGFACTQF